MNEKQIREVRIDTENSWAIHLETNAPINGDGIQSDWECAKTEGNMLIDMLKEARISSRLRFGRLANQEKQSISFNSQSS